MAFMVGGQAVVIEARYRFGAMPVRTEEHHRLRRRTLRVVVGYMFNVLPDGNKEED